VKKPATERKPQSDYEKRMMIADFVVMPPDPKQKGKK